MSTLIMEESRPINAFHPDDGSYTAYPTTTVNVQIKGLQIPLRPMVGKCVSTSGSPATRLSTQR